MTAALSRRLSAAGVRFLGILSRPGIQPPLRSACRAASGDADPDEVSVFHTRETPAGSGCPLYPGDGGVHGGR